MYKKAKFLIFCTIFVASAAFCQKSSSDLISFFTKSYNQNKKFGQFFLDFNTKRKAVKIYLTPKAGFKQPYLTVINSNYYTNNFGFFCKKEIQFEKATKIPLKFRLGSLQYNDYLEQKPNAIHQF